MTSRPITPVTLTGWHLALGLGPRVAGDGPAGVDHLLEGRAAFIAPHEELVGSGIDQLALTGGLSFGCPFPRCHGNLLPSDNDSRTGPVAHARGVTRRGPAAPGGRAESVGAPQREAPIEPGLVGPRPARATCRMAARSSSSGSLRGGRRGPPMVPLEKAALKLKLSLEDLKDRLRERGVAIVGRGKSARISAADVERISRPITVVQPSPLAQEFARRRAEAFWSRCGLSTAGKVVPLVRKPKEVK